MLNCFVRKYTKLGTLVRKSKAYVQCFKILDGTSCELVVNFITNVKKRKKKVLNKYTEVLGQTQAPLILKQEKYLKQPSSSFLFTFLFFPPTYVGSII